MKLIHNILLACGKPWAIQASGQPFVYFNYNPVGDNTKVYSSQTNDWERNYSYDMLGRRITYQEGELAESYTYDGSNPATHSQSWFENGMPQSKTTTYHYNAHRLDSVSYADALTTIYHYDQYGRVDSLYDESGVMCYEYGNMGEVTNETRIYALPFLSSPLALSTQFTYDSWGRIQNITYPDNEVVSYAYDFGGQLQSISNNSSYTYLDNVTYDRFGAKVSQTYGNGLVTNYSYNNLTRRLSTIATLDGNSQLSSFAYTYDNVGNVTQVASTCPWLNSQTFTEAFTYDASDQLTAAEETQSRSYRLDVTYGDWGRVSDYALTRTDMQDNSSTSDAYSFTYPANPSGVQGAQTMFAPESQTGTSDVQFTFGINGSLRKREVTSPDNYTEYYLFNSAANLKAYSNNGLDFAYYGYNASNTRSYKLVYLNANQWVNGQQQSLRLNSQQAMLYPNAYVNFNQNGEYTKHYYNGTERICSRLGENFKTIAVTVNGRLQSRIARADALFRSQIGELVSGDEPSLPSDRGGGGIRNLVSPTVEYAPVTTLTSLNPTGNPDDIYYYHTNHLGSTAYVTDQNQNITQGFLYAPFGEITTEFDANFGSDIIPKYSFNAKELDEETGMYYYEARYYKPPVFTSRDLMFEKYFWMTPYAYCANNPVKYVDPSGKEYGRPPRSRIEYRGNGVFGINKENLNRATRNRLAQANANPACWTYNAKTGQKDIGVNTTIATVRFSQESPIIPTVGVDAKHTSIRTVSERIAKSTGQPDKRSSHTIRTMSSGGGSRAFGVFSFAVNMVNLSYSYWDIFSVNGDMNAIAKQSNMLYESYKAVENSLGIIDADYQNTNDIGAIVNFVFQGENITRDPKISQIGTDILKKIGRYDKETGKAKPFIEE